MSRIIAKIKENGLGQHSPEIRPIRALESLYPQKPRFSFLLIFQIMTNEYDMLELPSLSRRFSYSGFLYVVDEILSQLFKLFWLWASRSKGSMGTWMKFSESFPSYKNIFIIFWILSWDLNKIRITVWKILWKTHRLFSEIFEHIGKRGYSVMRSLTRSLLKAYVWALIMKYCPTIVYCRTIVVCPLIWPW